MKKKLAIFLAMTICAVSLAACGGSGSAASSKAEEAKEEAQEAAGEAAQAVQDAAEAAKDAEQAATETVQETAEAVQEAVAETAADSDWAYIQGKGTMKVGITLFAPINYYDDANPDQLIGFDTELTEAVCAKIGITPEFVEIDWNSKEIELNSKNIDCIWNGMCITEERKQTMEISDPYLYNTQSIVMKTDRAEEIMAAFAAGGQGIKVVAESGSTGEGKIGLTPDNVIPDDDTVVVSPGEFFKNVEYTAVDSQAKALEEVKAGTADAAVVDSVMALGSVRPDSDFSDLTVNIDNNFGLQSYGIAFRKGSDTCALVNQALAELYADGTVAAIAEKYGLSDAMIQ